MLRTQGLQHSGAIPHSAQIVAITKSPIFEEMREAESVVVPIFGTKISSTTLARYTRLIEKVL